MRTTSIVSAAIAASLSFGSIAQADPSRHERGPGRDRGAGQQQRDHQWQGQRQGQERQQHRRDRPGAEQSWQQQRHAQNQHRPNAAPHRYQDGYRVDGRPAYRAAQAHGSQPHYGYSRGHSIGRHDAPRHVRGGYLPRQYMAQNYWVTDWSARRLAPPPYGYQWVQSDAGELILVALATGLIANVLFNF